MTVDRGRKRAGLWDMVVACSDEAMRIRQVQAALVKAGAREAADPAQARKAEVFEDASDLLRALVPFQREIGEILRTKRSAPGSGTEAEDKTAG